MQERLFESWRASNPDLRKPDTCPRLPLQNPELQVLNERLPKPCIDGTLRNMLGGPLSIFED